MVGRQGWLDCPQKGLFDENGPSESKKAAASMSFDLMKCSLTVPESHFGQVLPALPAAQPLKAHAEHAEPSQPATAEL